MAEQPKPLERLAQLEVDVETIGATITTINDTVGKLLDERSSMHQPRVWTERVALTSTVKDGFRVGEVTVTVQYQEGDPPTAEERQARLRAAIDDGQAIADEKNHASQQVKRFS